MTYAQARTEIARRVEQARAKSSIELDGERQLQIAFDKGVLVELSASLLMEREEWKARANSLARELELTR